MLTATTSNVASGHFPTAFSKNEPLSRSTLTWWFTLLKHSHLTSVTVMRVPWSLPLHLKQIMFPSSPLPWDDHLVAPGCDSLHFINSGIWFWRPVSTFTSSSGVAAYSWMVASWWVALFHEVNGPCHPRTQFLAHSSPLQALHLWACVACAAVACLRQSPPTTHAASGLLDAAWWYYQTRRPTPMSSWSHPQLFFGNSCKAWLLAVPMSVQHQKSPFGNVTHKGDIECCFLSHTKRPNDLEGQDQWPPFSGIPCSSFSVKELDIIVHKKYFPCITMLNFGHFVPHITSEPGGWGGN